MAEIQKEQGDNLRFLLGQTLQIEQKLSEISEMREANREFLLSQLRYFEQELQINDRLQREEQVGYIEGIQNLNKGIGALLQSEVQSLVVGEIYYLKQPDILNHIKHVSADNKTPLEVANLLNEFTLGNEEFRFLVTKPDSEAGSSRIFVLQTVDGSSEFSFYVSFDTGKVYEEFNVPGTNHGRLEDFRSDEKLAFAYALVNAVKGELR